MPEIYTKSSLRSETPLFLSLRWKLGDVTWTSEFDVSQVGMWHRGDRARQKDCQSPALGSHGGGNDDQRVARMWRDILHPSALSMGRGCVVTSSGSTEAQHAFSFIS